MAFGDVIGTPFKVAANSITNPTDATGSAVVSIGDLVFCVVGEQATASATGVTDNLGHTYTLVPNSGTDAGTSTCKAYYLRVTTAGTLTTLHVAAAATTDNVAIVGAAFEGPFPVSPLDANPAEITSDITSPFNCPATGALAQNVELVIAYAVATGSTVWSATAPNVLVSQQATQTVLHTVLGAQDVSDKVSVTPVFTAGANPTDAVLGTVSFKGPSPNRLGVYEQWQYPAKPFRPFLDSKRQFWEFALRPISGPAVSFYVHAACVTGGNSSSPAGSEATGAVTASGAQSITLSSAPASTSIIIGAATYHPTGGGAIQTPGAGWSTLYDDSGTNICTNIEYDTGVTSASVPWQNITGADTVSNGNAAQVALEFVWACAAVVATAQPLEEFDQWSVPARKTLVTAVWPSFVFVPPVTTAQVLQEFDQWPENRVKGTPISQRCESWQWPYLTPRASGTPREPFGQWPTLWSRLTTPLSQRGFLEFVYLSPQASGTPVETFDQWQYLAKPFRPVPAPEFHGHVPEIPRPLTPATLDHFDQWAGSSSRAPVRSVWTDLAFVKPSVTVVYGEFDPWAVFPRQKLCGTLADFHGFAPKLPSISLTPILDTGTCLSLIGPWTSGTFTPVSNSLLVVSFTTYGNYAMAPNFSISGGGLTWTKQVQQITTGNPDATEYSTAVIFTAPVLVAAPMAITVGFV